MTELAKTLADLAKAQRTLAAADALIARLREPTAAEMEPVDSGPRS